MVRATRNPSDEDIASGQVDEWPGIFMDMGIQYVHYASKTDKLYHWRPGVCIPSDSVLFGR